MARTIPGALGTTTGATLGPSDPARPRVPLPRPGGMNTFPGEIGPQLGMPFQRMPGDGGPNLGGFGDVQRGGPSWPAPQLNEMGGGMGGLQGLIGGLRGAMPSAPITGTPLGSRGGAAKALNAQRTGGPRMATQEYGMEDGRGPQGGAPWDQGGFGWLVGSSQPGIIGDPQSGIGGGAQGRLSGLQGLAQQLRASRGGGMS